MPSAPHDLRGTLLLYPRAVCLGDESRSLGYIEYRGSLHRLAGGYTARLYSESPKNGYGSGTADARRDDLLIASKVGEHSLIMPVDFLVCC